MKNKPKATKIISINVGRSSSAHEIALQLSFEKNIDILMVQEPYIYKDLSRRITRKHPSFECFTSIDDWNIRPRVMTYSRKDNGLTVSQIRPTMEGECSSDILYISLKSFNSPSILLINAYNAPLGAINPGSGIRSLLSLENSFFPQNTILAGDFNLHHHNWQPSYTGSISSQADLFVNWLNTRGLSYISEIDISTHVRGNVLDLCFATTQLVARGSTSNVQLDLDLTSDHKPLLITIPSTTKRSSITPKLRFATLDEKRFLSLLDMQLLGLDTIEEKTRLNIDNRAEKLTLILQQSFNGSAKWCLPHGRGQPWWDQSCRDAKKRYKQICRTGSPSTSDRKDFRKAVKKAKKSFFNKKLDMASRAKDVFEVSKWHKSKGNFRTPPLIDPLNPDNSPAHSLDEKRNVLIRNLLTNQSGAEDIPFSTPTVPISSLPFPELTEIEVERAILGARSTTPGKDGISTSVLRIAWPKISSLVYDLFQACVKIGYHPHCFRSAILAIIEKPNKLDMSSPRSYRPIALLSVLGKGLERLVARRMAWISIRHKVLALQQFGALPLRSSVDLTSCITHDIESVLAKGWTATLTTLDIKGAFDAVLPGRLVHRLREQGWPTQLCDWVSSFVSERRISIRLDFEIGPETSIRCGLPQGSPASPILFMLFISPLFKLEGLQKSFGYADDVALLETSPSLDENIKKVGVAIENALSWGKVEGLTFDHSKSELLHFTRRRKDKDYNPAIITENFCIGSCHKPPYIKWLGVHFDRSLTFKHHVRIQAAKAMKVVNALRCLGNTARGVSPILSRQVILACALSIANFGAETWWPRKTRKKGNKIVSNRVGTHLKILEKVYSAAARVILPVFRTTPRAALYRESGLQPAELTLDNISRRAAVRTRRLDPYHPLFIRARRSHANSILTRFNRSVLELPHSENLDPLRTPPWAFNSTTNNTFFRYFSRSISHRSSSNNFKNFIRSINPSDILVFSDGSKQASGNAGAGFVIYQLGRQVCSGSRFLGKNHEAHDAEVFAALYGIQAAIGLPTARFANNLWLFLDNKEVSEKLLTDIPPRTSQHAYDQALRTAMKWKTRSRLPHTIEGQVRVQWVPGHAGISGNELADIEAKKGASTPTLEPKSAKTFSSLEKWIQTESEIAKERWWNTQAPISYKNLEIVDSSNPPRELLLRRKELGRLIAARTGHGDFAAYHTRFKHVEAQNHCRCGSLKTTTHFLFCRILRRRGYRPPGEIRSLIPRLLGTEKGAFIFTKWMSQTKYFEEICIR